MPKTVEENRISFKLRRTSFLRDSNFNYNNDVVDVWSWLNTVIIYKLMSMTGYLLRYLSSKYFILGTKIYDVSRLYLCHMKSNAKASVLT